MKELFWLYKTLGRNMIIKDVLQASTISKTTRVVIKYNQAERMLEPVLYGHSAELSPLTMELKDGSDWITAEVRAKFKELGEELTIDPRRVPFLGDAQYRHDYRTSWEEGLVQEEGSDEAVLQSIREVLTKADTSNLDLREAFDMIDYNYIDTDLITPLLHDLRELGIFTKYENEKKLTKFRLAKLYRNKTNNVFVPMYLRNEYIAKTMYADHITRLCEDIKEWFDGIHTSSDDLGGTEYLLALGEEMLFGQLQDKLDGTGQGYYNARRYVTDVIRPYLSEKFAEASVGETYVAYEALDMILQDGLNPIFEAEATALEISDSLKLNPLSKEEFLEHVALAGIDFIGWKEYDLAEYHKRVTGTDIIKVAKAKEDNVWTVNPVNTKGVMGAGLAKQYRKAFPEHFEDYKEWCKTKKRTGGDIFVDDTNQIFGFASKEHWKDASKMEWIKFGVEELLDLVNVWGVDKLYMSLPGTGLGKLPKKEVNDLLVEAFKDSTTQLIIVGSGNYNTEE